MTRVKAFQAELKAKPEMRVEALFSVFDTIDQSNEVVLPSFFTDGQEVPMTAWGHNWSDLPVGKGVIRVTNVGAVFEGQFFDTIAGRDHYQTIKSMGGLQEWSWGFRVHEAYQGDFRGQRVTFLAQGEVFEVSPVLVGDNRETQTLAIKGVGPKPSLREIPADEVMGARVELANLARTYATKWLDIVPPRIRWWTPIDSEDVLEAIHAKRWPWPVDTQDGAMGWYKRQEPEFINIRTKFSGVDLASVVAHEIFHAYQQIKLKNNRYYMPTTDSAEKEARAFEDEFVFEFYKDARRTGYPLPDDDGEAIYHDGVWVLEDGVLAHDDGTIDYPNGKRIYADGRVRVAGGTVYYPSGTIEYADGGSFRPARLY